MVFSSLLFTYIFLPIVIVAYFIAQEKYRNYVLLVASLLFYSYGEPKFVFVMMASIMINYALAMAIDNRKRKSDLSGAKAFLVAGVIVNVGILFIFKYLDFSISALDLVLHKNLQIYNIALPIGISFFTFQALSYVIDVYRGTVEVQKNPLYVALYISLFPQLIAGPIVRYSSIEKQITNREFSLEGFSKGSKRFMMGFCKKVILANNLASVATEVFAMDSSTANPLLLWLGSICFSLQILFDFSGYSDMAIGLGKIFGFDFPENFDYPYMTKSVTEFWRRWHMTLGQWFRDYVYIPLGGSRVSAPIHILNMFIVWFLTGLWHGANYTFIIWGMGYFILLVIEKYIIKPEKRKNLAFVTIWRIISLLLINFGWVIFNAKGWKEGISYILGMVGGYGIAPVIDGTIIRYLREYGFFIILGVLFSTPIIKEIGLRMEKTDNSDAFEVATAILMGIVFLWAVSYLILGVHNPFIYFNF